MPIPFITDEIHTKPWIRLYRKKQFGFPVVGWPQRLSQFALMSQQSPSLPQHLAWLDKITRKASTYSTSHAGIPAAIHQSTAADILKWGGVLRGNLPRVPTVLKEVVQTARTGNDVHRAPMNSGWTKIAAVYAYTFPGAPQQVIWDSRVSLSICTRLVDYANSHHLGLNHVRTLYPNLGWIPGRGGNRPVLTSKASTLFPNRYGCWKAHFSGGQLAKDISDHLNQNIIKYGSPSSSMCVEGTRFLKSNNTPIPSLWDPWLVACVLFMDGQ
jgi:hypothetical protein